MTFVYKIIYEDLSEQEYIINHALIIYSPSLIGEAHKAIAGLLKPALTVEGCH
jgi:hypothetical protein